MPVERTLRRRRAVTLTPLIDIIFLLLLFFMLSSTFTRFGEVPLANAGGGATGEAAAPLFLQLGAAGLRLNGASLAMDDLPEALAGHAPAAEDARVTVLIALDAAVTSQDLVDLLAVLRGKTWLAVSVLG
jgi:biopolymer transport protein ExbD